MGPLWFSGRIYLKSCLKVVLAPAIRLGSRGLGTHEPGNHQDRFAASGNDPEAGPAGSSLDLAGVDRAFSRRWDGGWTLRGLEECPGSRGQGGRQW